GSPYVAKKPSGLIGIIEGARGRWHRVAVAGGDGMLNQAVDRWRGTLQQKARRTWRKNRQG
ncbi:hypothetical protein C7E12_21720, partial [Stenotrophomonas maltophilia]